MYHQIGMWDQKWVIGNWKMNGRLQNNNALMHRFRVMPTAERVLIGLAAPTVYLLQLHNAMQIVLNNRILTCAQDVSRFPNNGAYTGEVSAEMLADIGTDIVLIGHSERRQYFGETDQTVNARVRAALDAGLKVILCVGEVLEQREQGITEEVVSLQTKVALGGVSEEELSRVIIAYEPVWAIGTGKTATAEQAEEVCAIIRGVVAKLYTKAAADALTIQYGGSMKPGNAKELLSKEDVDGGLIGGAALVASDFAAIIDAAR